MKPEQKIINYLQNLGFEKNLVYQNFNNNIKTFYYNPLSHSDSYDKSKFKLQFFFYKKSNMQLLYNYNLEKWNENKLNFLIAVNEDETHIIDIKQKPEENQPLRSKIGRSFNYGINSEGFEKESIKELLKENIDNSYFWNYVIKRRKQVNEVDDDLLNNLVALHKELTKENNNYEEINLLILQCLFLKYLEDRGVFKNELILIQALKNDDDKALKKVFKQIKTINGDIFNNISFDINSHQLQQLAIFFEHDYREYKNKNQLFALSPYKYDKIPIELISNVYEEFLGKTDPSIKKKQGIFYTRTFVVDFILSHSVYPETEKNKKITILDPACGSGIFLVQSFKEILNQHRDSKIDDKIALLKNQIFGIDIDERALQIAAFSLYLALLESCSEDEILDRIEKKKPMLPDLIGENLLKKNAIADDIKFKIGSKKIDTFGCIVGNPPWGHIDEIEYTFDNSLDILKDNNIPDSIINKLKKRNFKTDKFEMELKKILTSEEIQYIDKLVEYSKINDNEQVKERRVINNDSKYCTVSYYQRSQCFLLRINQWCNENTEISLIVNNSNFLNNKSERFRRNILQQYNISKYFDLSNITDIAFSDTKEPGSILIMDKKKNAENILEYTTAQLTDFAKAFHLIHYTSIDIKKVKQKDLLLEDQDIIWKIFVNGNWDDYQLVKKIELSNFKSTNLECKRGFQLDQKEKINSEKLAPWKLYDFEEYVISYPNIEKFNWNREFFRLPLPESFNSEIFENDILPEFNDDDKDVLTNCYKYSPKPKRYVVRRRISALEKLKTNILLGSINQSLFTGKKILISRSLSEKKIKCAFNSEEIPFGDNILCLKSEEIQNYFPLAAIINSSVIGYYIQFYSPTGFRLSSNIIKNLPIPEFDFEDPKILELTNLAKQIQTAKKDKLHTFHLEEQIDELVFDIYGLLDFEKEVIREFYDVNVHRVKEDKEVNSDDLQKYVSKFRDVFSFILDDKLALNADYSFQNLGSAVCFSIVKKEDFVPEIIKEDSKILQLVKKKQLEESIFSKAINEEKIKIYNEENFTIIKSKYFKDWTVRQAMKDANEEIGLIVKKLPNE